MARRLDPTDDTSGTEPTGRSARARPESGRRTDGGDSRPVESPAGATETASLDDELASEEPVAEEFPDEDAIDEVAFLARSPVRVRALHVLSRRDYVGKRELREELDGVRTTVSRNLNALEERGWVEDTPEGYTITSCGRMVVDELVDLSQKMSLAVKLRPTIKWLDVEELGLDVEQFQRASIVSADETNPYAPVEEQVDLIRRSDQVRAAVPTLNRRLLEVCLRNAREGTDVELLVETDSVDRFRSESRYAELFEDATEHCEVREIDGSIPYYVGVSERVIQLGTTDGDNVLRVLIDLEDEPEVRTWARERFDTFRDRSDPVV